jgi:HK97 family phage portal protein
MGLFNFGGNKEERSLSLQTEQAFSNGDSLDTDTATPQSALNLPSVYSAMYVIASAFGQLPLHVLRRNGDIVEKATDHPASNLLKLEPNIWQTSYKWRETEQFRCLGWGNAYTQIVRSRGRVVEFKTLRPWATQLLYRIGANGQKHYYYNSYDDDGTQIIVQPEDMIHIRDVGYDEKIGRSRISQHADALGWALSMQDYGKSFFGSNGRPTGAVSPKMELNEGSWERFKAMWNKAAGAMSASSNRTMLLPAELTYQSFTIPPEDMQFLESRKLSRNEIASIFNVPPHMIGDLERATFSNISEQALQFVKYTMMPWIVAWEQEITRKLFSISERAEGYYVKFDLAGLLRGAPKDRAEFYDKMIQSGVYSRQEVRAFEDMNPVNGLDEMVISQNVKSVRFMDAEADLKVDEAKQGFQSEQTAPTSNEEVQTNE